MSKSKFKGPRSSDKFGKRQHGAGPAMEGMFTRRSNGKNAFIPDDSEDSYFVADRNSLHAMDGDKVKARLFAKRDDRDPEAEIVDVLERAQTTFVGELDVENRYAFLMLDSKILANDIFIPRDKIHGGKSGQKALVRILEWPKDAKNPIGEVLDVLGKAGDNDTEMHAILAQYGLPYTYPEEVEKEAEKIPLEIPSEEIKKREDFRDVLTFTIDPKDAKDFDDALSIRKIADDKWEVGVHIADVSYYVKPGSLIDKEAQKRATSIYLVDRTIPMLPERLCNGVCSLRQDEEKLAFSVIFEMNSAAEIQKYHIARTVIKSNRRFVYDDVQTIIETGEGEYKEEILVLDGFAKKLRAKRFREGAINFDRYEVKFDIDEKGKPLRVYFKMSNDANKLVEEFMLLANKLVAESVGRVPEGKKAKTFVYRVHDVPDPEKMQTFNEFVQRFGYKMRTTGSNNEISKSINDLLDKVQGKKEENLIETVAIRAMSKAHYSTCNIGHYGLAFPYYTHFTSPIRRYPDTMVHRLIERYMEGKSSVPEDSTEKLCEHCSEMENVAVAAERASVKYKQVEFMEDKLGNSYDGVISGVTEWGLYVEINENKCEGMVPIRDLDDDFYEFDEKNYCLVGKKSRKTYRLGDDIRITVARTNLERRQLDFALAEKEEKVVLK